MKENFLICYNPDMKLLGKIAIVTGGSSGIGFAIATKLAHEGAITVIVGRDSTKGNKAASEIPNSIFFSADVTKDTSVKELIEKVITKYAKLDIVVNAAGMNVTHGDITKLSEETYGEIMDTDFKSIVFMTKHAMPHLLKTKGTMVNIASQYAFTPDSEVPLYCSAKAAVVMFTKTMALTYGKDGVRVNAVCPGAVKTPLLQQFFDDEKELTEWYADSTRVPLMRTGKSEEIAHVVSFLVSDEASYVTGAAWLVDGGSSLP